MLRRTRGKPSKSCDDWDFLGDQVRDDLLGLVTAVTLWYRRTSSARTHSMFRTTSVASWRLGSIPSARCAASRLFRMS